MSELPENNFLPGIPAAFFFDRSSFIQECNVKLLLKRTSHSLLKELYCFPCVQNHLQTPFDLFFIILMNICIERLGSLPLNFDWKVL